jgi:hypothetical protein
MSSLWPEKKSDSTWLYPCLADVLEIARLQTIAHYMGVRWQTVANFILNQPIWELCAGAVLKRGSLVQPFWWDQPMDLDLARMRGLWPLPLQGPLGPAVVEDNDKDQRWATEPDTD